MTSRRVVLVISRVTAADLKSSRVLRRKINTKPLRSILRAGRKLSWSDFSTTPTPREMKNYEWKMRCKLRKWN